MIRGARILHKMQNRYADDFKDTTDLIVTNEILKEIADTIFDKATRAAETGRYSIALNYLSAISDYPDTSFDYEENEAKINKLVKDCFANLNVR